jgi:hypothetical protein
VELSGRDGGQGGGVVGSPPDCSTNTFRVCPHLRSFLGDGMRVIEHIIGARASGIPSDEAWRDVRSDQAHALLPADIFSTSVQLGALPETRFYLRRCGGRSVANEPDEAFLTAD